MKYNSSCVQPSCTLVTEENGDQQVSLEELQVSQHASPTVLIQACCMQTGSVPMTWTCGTDAA